MKRIGTLAMSAALLATTAGMAAAQLTGIPLGPVETGTGISIAADYGKPDSKMLPGGGSAYGVTGGIGFSNFGLSASVGAIKPTGLTAQTSFGGRLGMKVFGGGLMPVSVGVQVGVASAKTTVPATPPATGTVSSTITSFMPGAFVRVSPPLFPLKPWGQVYYVTGNSSVVKEVRFAVGVNFNLLLGLGVHAGYDFGNKGGNTWGVGAHFNFHVPGLGVPGV